MKHDPEIHYIQRVACRIKAGRHWAFQSAAADLACRSVLWPFVHREVLDDSVFDIHANDLCANRVQHLADRRSFITEERDKGLSRVPKRRIAREIEPISRRMNA